MPACYVDACMLNPPPWKATVIGGKHLSPEETILVERVLRMAGGYVLNFSDRTLRGFFSERFSVDIDAEAYRTGNSGSKANRVRSFLRQTPLPQVGRVMKAFLTHGIETEFADQDDPTLKPGPPEIASFSELADRFGAEPATPSPPPTTTQQPWAVAGGGQLLVPPESLRPEPDPPLRPASPVPWSAVTSGGAARAPVRRFRVALSFAGAKRSYVHVVARLLASKFGEDKVLYDEFHRAEFARPNLGMYLPDLYKEQSDLLVAILCHDYERKPWTGLEWRAIHELLMNGHEKRIMLCRFDLATMRGLYDSDGYIELERHTPVEAADLILERLAVNEGLPRSAYARLVRPAPALSPPTFTFPVPTSTTHAGVPRLAMPRHGIHPPPFLSSAWWAHVDGGEDLLVRAHGQSTGDTFLGTFKSGSIRPTMGGFHWRAFLTPADHELGSNVVTDINSAKGRILDLVEDNVPGFKAFLAATGTPGI